MPSTDFRSLANLDLSNNRLVNAGLELFNGNPAVPFKGQVGFQTALNENQNHAILNLDGASSWGRLVMANQTEIITGAFTFSPATPSTPPFAVGANAIGMRVVGLSAEMLSDPDVPYTGRRAHYLANPDTIAQRYINGRLQVGTPTAANDATTKAYVDNVASGNRPVAKGPVRVATTQILPGTYSAATNSITATNNGAPSTQTAIFDNVTLVVNDRVLFKDQVPAFGNGIFYLKTLGTASTPNVFERTDDADDAAEVTTGATVNVKEGTTFRGTKFRQSLAISNVDTDPETWVVDSVTDLLAGPGIVVTANKISFVDETGYPSGALFYAAVGTSPVQTISMLGIGTSGYFLTSDGTKPVWASVPIPSLPTLRHSSLTAGLTINPSAAVTQAGAALAWTYSIDPDLFLAFANPANLVNVGANTFPADSGTAKYALRSDVQLRVDPGIIPTWTALHTFNAGLSTTAPGSATPTHFVVLPTDPVLAVSRVSSMTVANVGTLLKVPKPSGPINPVRLTAIDGTLTDGTGYLPFNTQLALDQAIAPNWTGIHTWVEAAATRVINTKTLVANGNPNLSIRVGGAHGWGDGVDPEDVFLTRSAANTLRLTNVLAFGNTGTGKLNVDRILIGADALAAGAALPAASVLLFLDAASTTTNQLVQVADKAHFQAWLGMTGTVTDHGLPQHTDVNLTNWESVTPEGRDEAVLYFNHASGKWVGGHVLASFLTPIYNGGSAILFGARQFGIEPDTRYGHEVSVGAGLLYTSSGQIDEPDILSVNTTIPYKWVAKHTFEPVTAVPAIAIKAQPRGTLASTDRIFAVTSDPATTAQDVVQFPVSALTSFIGQPTLAAGAVGYGDVNGKLTGVVAELNWNVSNLKRLGINVAAPLDTLDMVGAFRLTNTIPTGTVTAMGGLRVTITDTSTSTADWTARQLVGGYVDVRKSGSAVYSGSATMYGWRVVSGLSAGSIVNLYGVESLTVFGAVGAPAALTIVGFRSTPENSGSAAGALTNFYHFAAVDFLQPYPQPQFHFGLVVPNLVSTSGATRTAGLSLSLASSGVGERYNVYAPGAAPSHFAGAIGLGVTYPNTNPPTTDPKARLEFAVGSTTGLAPMKFAATSTASTLLTTPLSAVVECRGDRLTYTDVAATPLRHPIAHLDDVNFTNDPSSDPAGAVIFGPSDKMKAAMVPEIIGTTPVTLWARVMIPTVMRSATYDCIMAIHRENGTANDGYNESLQLQIYGNGLTFWISSTAANLRWITVPNVIANYGGKVVDIVAVRNGSTPSIYINGVLQAVGADSTVGAPPAWNMSVNNQVCTIGQSYSTSGSIGRVYRAAVFNRALSVLEVGNLSRYGVDDSDQWGSMAVIYTSDFTTSVDGWVPNGGASNTLSFNQTLDGTTGWLTNQRITTDGRAEITRAPALSRWNSRVRITGTAFHSTTQPLFLGISSGGYPSTAPFGGSAPVSFPASVSTPFALEQPIKTTSNDGPRIEPLLTSAAGAAAVMPVGTIYGIKGVTMTQIGALADWDFGVGYGSVIPDRSGRFPGTMSSTTGWYHLISDTPTESYLHSSRAGGLRMGAVNGDRVESTVTGGIIGTGDFSVSVKFRVSSTPAGVTCWLASIISSKATTTAYDFSLAQLDNNLYVGWRNGSAATVQSSTIDISKYIGLVIEFTVRRTAGVENALINGTRVNYTPSTSSASSLANGASTLYHLVGNYTTSGPPFHEVIYSYRFFNKSLTDAEVLALVRHGVHHADQWGTLAGPVLGCVLGLDFGGASTLVVPDNSTNNFDGTVTGSAEYVSGHLHDLSTVHSKQTQGIPWVGSDGRLTADAAKMKWDGTTMTVFGQGDFRSTVAIGTGGTIVGNAWLELAAGTVSKAQLRLGVGTFMTTPVSGSIENDGVRPWYTTATPQRRGLAFVDEVNFTNDVSSQQAGAIVFGRFDRVHSALTYLGYTEAIGSDPFTLYARFLVPTSMRGPNWDGVIGLGAAFNTVTGQGVGCAISGTSLVISFFGNGGGNSRAATVAGFLAAWGGKVVDLVVVRSGNVIPIIYVNGISQTASETSAGAAPAWDNAISSQYLILGCTLDTYGSVARIYRAALFNRALTAAEARSLGSLGVNSNDQWGSTAPLIAAADGAFTADTGYWTKGGTATVSGGTGNLLVLNDILTRSPIVVRNKNYEAKFTFPTLTGIITVSDTFSGLLNYSTPGAYSLLFLSTSTGLRFHQATAGASTVDNVSMVQSGAVIDLDLAVGCGTVVPDRSGRYPGTIAGTEWQHLISKCPAYLTSGSGFITYGVRRYVQRAVTLATPSVTITHGLGTKDVAVQLWQDDLAVVAKFEAGIEADTVNTVKIYPATFPVGAKATVVVIG